MSVFLAHSTCTHKELIRVHELGELWQWLEVCLQSCALLKIYLLLSLISCVFVKPAVLYFHEIRVIWIEMLVFLQLYVCQLLLKLLFVDSRGCMDFDLLSQLNAPGCCDVTI